MFSDNMDGLGNLVNKAAIALLQRNAYDAASVTLGHEASVATIQRIVEAYVKYVTPRTNSTLTLDQILHDPNFQAIIEANRDGGMTGSAAHGGGWGLFDHAIMGLPNWLVYAGIGGAAYWYYKKSKRSGVAA